MSSKDRHDNLILQESPQKPEEEEEEEEEEGVASRKDDDGDEDEEGVASRKGDDVVDDDDDENEEGVASRKDDDDDDDDEKEGEEECKTPCSTDYKIPTIQGCPSTPRKKTMRWANSHNKRKLSELQFFETTRREEVESFFRSNSEPFTTAATDDVVEPRSIKRRRCRSA